MIIQTKEDIVTLSGSLNKNLWMTIKAATNLLLTALRPAADGPLHVGDPSLEPEATKPLPGPAQRRAYPGGPQPAHWTKSEVRRQPRCADGSRAELADCVRGFVPLV